jgi:hypothetical protein
VGKTHSGGRVGDANEVLAGWALNLAPGKLRFTFQRLIAVGAVEFEFVCVHSLCLHKRKAGEKSMSQIVPCFLRTNRA